ncbi:hypothetical protein EDB87DRAFT_1580049 [Lactarius vividus]|nr:hypothetical protein EDB87DRAFT_1580049 [Lactarius vividus]
MSASVTLNCLVYHNSVFSVQIPDSLPQQPQASTSNTNVVWTKGMTIVQLEAALDFPAQASVVSKAKGAPPPSSIAVFPRFYTEQERRPIWNGRPSTNCGIPIQLYHRAFADFLRIARGDIVDIDLKPEVYSATHSLFHSSAAFYLNEASRVESNQDVFGSGHWPSASSVGGPWHVFRRRHHRGPWTCILGAVFVESAVVQQLTDFIWIGGHPYDNRKLESVTRILTSLGKGIADLQEFYQEVSRRGRDVDFKYKAYLFPDTPDTPKDPSKAISSATTETEGERRDIIVKFTQRYNAEAHRYLATEGHAPELLYCSKEDPNSADLAVLIMVVMEQIDGKTAYEQIWLLPT